MSRMSIIGLRALSCLVVLSACATAESQSADADPGPVTCRDVLEPPSNVMRNRCLTERGWREYERSSERGAREFMRRMDSLSTRTQP